MVAYDFIDLSDGEWHLLPQSADNIVFEGRNMTGVVSIETSHDKLVSHSLYSVSHNANQDHDAVQPNNGDFVLQYVRAVNPGSQTVRVYFSYSKRAK